MLRGNGKCLLNGYRVSFVSDENALELDSGIGCMMYLMPLNCT